MPAFPNLRSIPPTALAALVVFASVSIAHAQEPPPGPPGVSHDEAEAQAIDAMLMCPVCPAETIDQAQVPLARQMRAIVRQKLSGGETREEILDYFADRYGQSVIGAPPKSGINLVAWVLPPVGVAAALLVGVLSLRAMTASRRTAAQSAAQDNPVELQPYLDIVDRELNSGTSGLAGEISSRGGDGNG